MHLIFIRVTILKVVNDFDFLVVEKIQFFVENKSNC